MDKKLLIGILAVLCVCGIAFAEEKSVQQDPFKWEVQMNINAAQMSLQDKADKVYTGDIDKTGVGIGVHTFLFFPFAGGLSFGPNFNFTYEQINNNQWYSFDIYHFSVGPSIKYYWGEYPFYVFANYDLGFLVTEQEISSVSGYPAPAGNFVANLHGFVFGWRGQVLNLFDQYTVGPYITYSMPTMFAFTYRTLITSKPENRWVDINTSFLQFGLSIAYK